MTDITIPAAAMKAACRAYEGYTLDVASEDALLLACLAMLNAWEGAKTIRDDGRRQTYAIPALILPLSPQENPDAEA